MKRGGKGERGRRSERGRRRGGRTTTGASSRPPAPRGPGKHMAKCWDEVRVSGNDKSPCQPIKWRQDPGAPVLRECIAKMHPPREPLKDPLKTLERHTKRSLCHQHPGVPAHY